MPLYFELADSNLKLGRWKRAEGFLIGAHWTLLKQQPGEDETQGSEADLSKLRSRLLKSFGDLFTQIGNYEEALKSLTENIYLESLDRGPEHYLLSGSYYLMGNIFLSQNRRVEALNFYRQMYLIWKKFLNNLDSEENKQVKKVEIGQACNEISTALEFIENEAGENSDMAIEARDTHRELTEVFNDLNRADRRRSSFYNNE